MSHQAFTEKKMVLDTMFRRRPKIFEWQIDLFENDLGGMQRAILKRLYSRREKFAEVAAHFGIDKRDLDFLLKKALKKLKQQWGRFQGTDGNSSLEPKNQIPERFCEKCCRKIKDPRFERLCPHCLRLELKNQVCDLGTPISPLKEDR